MSSTKLKKTTREYKLIKNLWYSIRDIVDDQPIANANNVDVLTNPFTEYGHSCRSLRSAPAEGFKSLDGRTHNISYEGLRIPKNNDYTSASAVFKETFVINTPNGSVSGVALYNDSGDGSTTTIPTTDWIINGGTGIFKDANFAQMTYDNEGTIFGYKFSRKIKIMQVLDTTEQDTPTSGAPVTPNVPSLPSVPSLPTVPSIPTVPTIPNVPSIPSVPTVPTVPNVPSIPTVPTVPNVPSIPTVPTVPTIPNVPSIPSSNERCCEDLELLKNEVRVLVNIVKKDLSRKKK